jgi:hypothetical protein
MADEQITTPQEEKPVTEKSVTDADLASAWDEKVEVKEEPKQEEKQESEVKEEVQEHKESEIPEEPVDNAERSKLGRKLKQMEDFNKQLFDAQQQLLEEIRSLRSGKEPQSVPQNVSQNVTYNDSFIQQQLDAAVERGEIPATIVTPQDQIIVNKFLGGLQRYMGNQYANQYLKTITSNQLKGETPDDVHAEVVAELQRVESPFNLRRYDNPGLDAQMNYLEAKTHILQKKLSENKPQSAFKGTPKDAPPMGTSVSTRTETHVNDLPDLDEYSKEFIKKTGMSTDSVKAALDKKLPFHMRSRF